MKTVTLEQKHNELMSNLCTANMHLANVFMLLQELRANRQA